MISNLSSISVGKSRRDDILSLNCAVPAGLWGECMASLVRRLKPTVNNMPSLRDFSPLTQHYCKLFIFNHLASIKNQKSNFHA